MQREAHLTHQRGGAPSISSTKLCITDSAWTVRWVAGSTARRRRRRSASARRSGPALFGQLQTLRKSTPASASPSALTFSAFSSIWKEQRGALLAAARDDGYRLKTISGSVLPVAGGMAFGDKPLAAITAEDIEAFRDWRKKNGL